MSKLCLSSTSKTHFSTLHMSDFFFFFFFCSFILSQPLYFSYFIFFSPCLLKLLFFLSPLFISTSLLLLAPITISQKSSRSVAERLRSKIDKQNEEFLRLKDFEVFKIVFENPIIDDDIGNQVEVLDTEVKDDASQASKCSVLADSQQDPTLAGSVELENFAESKSNLGIIEEEKRFVGFLRELDEFENVKARGKMEKKKVEPQGMDANKAIEKQGENSIMLNGSKAAAGNKIQSWPSLDYNLGGYGSMRKEKDWKSTLACKLLEERNSADNAGERMDLLWETYENETKEQRKNKASNSKSNKKKNKKKYYEIKHNDVKEVTDWNGKDEEEDESDGQLCCLRALKFSARKMTLRMGKPNLVNISKTIKGIGWLHNLSRHSKKVHNGDIFY